MDEYPLTLLQVSLFKDSHPCGLSSKRYSGCLLQGNPERGMCNFKSANSSIFGIGSITPGFWACDNLITCFEGFYKGTHSRYGSRHIPAGNQWKRKGVPVSPIT